MHPVCACTRPSPAPHISRRPLRASGRAWLSSYYLVFLACFLDLAESSKKAHGTEGTSQLRRCPQKEGWHQKQSNLQGNQGRHEPARMCSFARLACCRRRHPASLSPLRSLCFLSFFGVSVSNPRPAGGRAGWGAQGSGRATARRQRSRDSLQAATTHARSTTRSHAFILYFSLLYDSIGRESSRCLTSSVLVARSPHGFL